MLFAQYNMYCIQQYINTFSFHKTDENFGRLQYGFDKNFLDSGNENEAAGTSSSSQVIASLRKVYTRNDWKLEITRYTIFRYVWYILLAQLFSEPKVIATLQTRSGPEFLWSVVDTTHFILLCPSFFLQINFIPVSEITINFKFLNIILSTIISLKRDVYFQKKTKKNKKTKKQKLALD
jgi:hypothetical protein